jgi:exopolysaccharide biosynthesis polyprenyl glycosylphosphotransferase
MSVGFWTGSRSQGARSSVLAERYLGDISHRSLVATATASAGATRRAAHTTFGYLGRVSQDLLSIFGAVLIGRWICRLRFPSVHVSVAYGGVLTCVAAVVLVAQGSYGRSARLGDSGGLELRRIFIATVGSSLFLGAFSEAAFRQHPSLLGSVALVAPAFMLVPTVRRGVTALSPLRQRSDSRVIVVGAGRVADRLVMRLRRSRGITVVGLVDDDPPPSTEVIGGLADLPRLCVEHEIGRVLVAFSRTPLPVQLEQLRCLGQDISVSIVPRLYEMVGWGSTLDDFLGIPVVHAAPSRGGTAAVVGKRILDIGVASVMLVLFAPVLLVAAITIKLTSPGPVLFRQARTGLNGRTFNIFKLRTMTTDAEYRRSELLALNEVDGPIFKIRSDPRIFPVGAFLRKSSIDELPQLLNVLRGEMSVVGPRPLPVEEAARVAPSFGVSRTRVRPGITGLWQVCGRSALNSDDLEQLDAAYAASWSLRWDLQILLRTPGCVLRRSGAY